MDGGLISRQYLHVMSNVASCNK